MIEKICKNCGCRMNPYTAIEKGVTSKHEYETVYCDPIYSWCVLKDNWITDDDNCWAWISFEKYECETDKSYTIIDLRIPSMTTSIWRKYLSSRQKLLSAFRVLKAFRVRINDG